MRQTLIWTFLSISALITSLLIEYYLDIRLRLAILEMVRGPGFTPQFAVGAVANIITPLLVLFMTVSLFRATDRSSVAGVIYLVTGTCFTIFPVVVLSIPLLKSIRLLWRLPFHPYWMAINNNAPFSRMYYVTGIILILGIVGIFPRLKSWIRAWLLPLQPDLAA